MAVGSSQLVGSSRQFAVRFRIRFAEARLDG
jgi:hypothetical protein